MPHTILTLTCLPSLPIHRRTSNQYIIHHGKYTLATNPGATFVSNRTIVQHGRFVQLHAVSMNGARKWQFMGVEIIPAGTAEDLVRVVAEHYLDAVRCIADGGVAGEIW